jgi:tape measure domain-containing protein
VTDQNIFVRLAANITGFRADMAKAAQALRGVGQTAAAASAQASAAAKTMGQAMDDAHKKTQRLSGGLKGVGAQLSAIAAGLGVGWGLKAASEIETITIGFEGMLGSAEEADEFVRELQQFAAVTPFEFPGLAKAAQQFLGLGYSTEEAMARVDAIGRALATTGNLSDEAVTRVTRALAQIQGKGKLAAQELNQINENLPNLQRTMVYDVIAEKMDKTREQVVKLADEGLIPAEVALDAIYEVMTELPGAAESFEKSSQTLAGMMSTLKDNLRFAAAEGFKPLAQAIKDTLGPLLSQLGPLLGTILGPLGEGLADVFAGLAQTFTTLGPRLGELADVVGSLLSALAPLVPLAAGLLNAVLIPLLPVIQAVAGALEFLMNDIPGLQGALQGLATAFIALKVMSSLPAIMSALSTAYTAIGVTAINAGAGVAKLRVALTGLMSSAGGIGLVLSAAAAAYSLFAAGNAEAEDSTKSFTDAINAQKFATDAAVKSWLLQDLTTGTYIQLLNPAGNSVEDFIKGSTDINKVTGATGEKFTDLQHALRAAMEAGNLTEEEWDKLGAAAFDVYGKLNQMQNAARATAGVTDALGLSAGEVAPELKDLAKSIEDMTDAGDAF